MSKQGDLSQEKPVSVGRTKDASGSLRPGKQNQHVPTPLMTAEMLDSANNRLQELMQILYLLSRDPALPNDARYHVTVAQSEIALLAREMRNNLESQTANATPPKLKSFAAAQP